jgi:hypothetical protein
MQKCYIYIDFLLSKHTVKGLRCRSFLDCQPADCLLHIVGEGGEGGEYRLNDPLCKIISFTGEVLTGRRFDKYYVLETVPNKNVYYTTKINTWGFLMCSEHASFSAH